MRMDHSERAGMMWTSSARTGLVRIVLSACLLLASHIALGSDSSKGGGFQGVQVASMLGPSGQKAGIKRSRAGGGHGELHEKPEMKISDMTLTLDGWEDETPIFSPYEKVGCTQSLIRGE